MDLPSWIAVKPYDKEAYLKTKALIDDNALITVCVEANCPNRYECFASGTATFMILGDTCRRGCRYCNIKKGKPTPVDVHEPGRIADAVQKLDLNYAVITCVTRDDLPDGGAEHFVNTLNAIRARKPGCKVELLISDLNGNWDSLKRILDSKPDVLNHNIEVVRDIFPLLRPNGDYAVSLALLKKAKELDPSIKTKSGFMLGLGESEGQIIQTIKDLKEVDCDIITIGQYLQPSARHYEVKNYYSPEEFDTIKQKAEEIGITPVVAGPMVRSSYKAYEMATCSAVKLNENQQFNKEIK